MGFGGQRSLKLNAMEDAMSNKDYETGRRDGKHSTFDPPHSSLWKDYGLGTYSKEEREDRQEYRQGYGHGKKESKWFLTVRW